MVSSARNEFRPTLQNSNSGDAACDGEDILDSHSAAAEEAPPRRHRSTAAYACSSRVSDLGSEVTRLGVGVGVAKMVEAWILLPYAAAQGRRNQHGLTLEKTKAGAAGRPVLPYPRNQGQYRDIREYVACNWAQVRSRVDPCVVVGETELQ
jgi:hypothetical protein